MDLQDIDKILSSKIDFSCPPDFTSKVVNSVNSLDAEDTSIKIISFQWGLSLLVAGLVIMFLNLSQLTDILSRYVQADAQSGYTTQVSHKFYSIMDKTTEFFSKPVNTLTESLWKEN